jgi:PKD repeat protein
MLVADVFKVFLYEDPTDMWNFIEGEDITSGILSVDIVSGSDIYEGPQQQIDTGQFTIVTRNPALDPKINPKLKYNSAIHFIDERSGMFFRGFVTDVEVEYQRKDDPIITITGTDIFGAMQRVVIDQDVYDAIMALSTGPTWNGLTFSEFLPYMYKFTSKYLYLNYLTPGPPEPWGFWFNAVNNFGQESFENLGYAPARYIPQVGETYLDVINKYAQTNLTSFSFNNEQGFDSITVFSFPKYDPNFWLPQQDPYLTYTNYDFSSDPVDGKPYEAILLDNGYNRVINQVDISNESRFVDAGQLESTTESFTRISDESIEDYAISRASISTIYPENNELSNVIWADKYSENIFQTTQFPGQEIKRITFDNARYEDIENDFSYSNYPYTLHRMIRIKHQINANETIDKIYNIAGITHSITPDKWEMGFTLKPSREELAFTYQGSLPTIQMNSTTGDANFNFTATVENIDPSRVNSIVWALSAADGWDVKDIFPYAVNGNMFKNGIARTGYTQTWNFDDDGILAPYSFDSDSIYTDPTDNRYGGYGPGYWVVYAFILLENGYTIVLQQPLTVGTPEVEADFGWAQNLTNNFGTVQFTDTSVNNETGEPDTYAWDFGDGTTSAERNPLKTYVPVSNENEYEVSLTVFAYGEDEEKIYDTHTETVTLVQPTMVPDFTFTQNQQTITFTNTSTNVGFEEPDAYLWDFGDGTTSTEKNPVKIYAVAEEVSTSFSVTLTTRNIWEQTESITKTVTVLAINSSGTFPVRYIKFLIAPYTKSGTVPSGGDFFAISPVMSNLRAVTSGTGANLVYLKPLIGFEDNGLPYMQWRATNGAAVQQNLGWEYFLTRDPSITPISSYGDGPGSQHGLPGGLYKTVRWELVVDIGQTTQTISDIILRFEDYLVSSGFYAGLQIESFYPRIDVLVANTITGYTPNPAGTYGSATLNGNWVNIGYFKLDGGRMDPTKPAGERTNTTKSITPRRQLPLNTPYFLFGFNDKTVNFYSIEEADSYAWTFGNGTTATGRTPSVTYADYGTYTVTLEVTNGGVVTRTTTEPVFVRVPVS